jgi:hypothetical protein
MGDMRHALGLLVFVLMSAPALAEGKTVRDWTAACDESGTCIAETTGSGGLAMGGQGYRLQLGRHAGDSSAWFLQFIMKNVPQPSPDSDLYVTIDNGERFILSRDYGYFADADEMTFGLGNTFDLDKLFAQFKQGKALELSFNGADSQPHKETFSLSGSVATMLWIDEQQKRVGNSDEIDSPTGVMGEAEFTPEQETVDEIKKLSAQVECSDTGEERKIQSYHLPGGKALHLLPCFSGPYNFTHLFFADRGGDITQQFFADYSRDYGWTGTDQLFNIDFDPKTGRLHSFYKGRGVGDCGSAGEWVWHNDLFRLISFQAWDDCEHGRPAEEWPVVFTYKHEAKGP